MQVSVFVKNITNNKQFKLILYWDEIIAKADITSWKLENTFFSLRRFNSSYPGRGPDWPLSLVFCPVYINR